MISFVWAKPFLPGLALCLTACATNALRVEYAADVAGKAKVAAAASRDYLVIVDRTRVAANVDLIAIDPSCVPNQAFVRRLPDFERFRNPLRPPRGWLCAAEAKEGITYDRPFSLAPLGFDLEPTFVLLEALGSYSSALAKIVDAEGQDPVKDLADAVGLARSAEGLLRSLAGGAPIVPAAEDKRLTAVTDFIGFISELQNEKTKVGQIRKLTGSVEGSATIIPEVRNHLAAWELSRRSDEGLRLVLSGVMIQQVQRAEPPLPADRRREFAQAYYDRAAGAMTAAKLKPALDAALAEVADADNELRRVLAADPQLSKEERATLARITRERLVRAFDTLSQLVLAFRGG